MSARASTERTHGNAMNVDIASVNTEHAVLVIDRREAARMLATTERHIRRLASDGRLPVVRIGGKVRFLKADVLKMITGNTAPRAASSIEGLDDRLRTAPPFRLRSCDR